MDNFPGYRNTSQPRPNFSSNARASQDHLSNEFPSQQFYQSRNYDLNRSYHNEDSPSARFTRDFPFNYDRQNIPPPPEICDYGNNVKRLEREDKRALINVRPQASIQDFRHYNVSNVPQSDLSPNDNKQSIASADYNYPNEHYKSQLRNNLSVNKSPLEDMQHQYPRNERNRHCSKDDEVSSMSQNHNKLLNISESTLKNKQIEPDASILNAVKEIQDLQNLLRLSNNLSLVQNIVRSPIDKRMNDKKPFDVSSCGPDQPSSSPNILDKNMHSKNTSITANLFFKDILKTQASPNSDTSSNFVANLSPNKKCISSPLIPDSDLKLASAQELVFKTKNSQFSQSKDLDNMHSISLNIKSNISKLGESPRQSESLKGCTSSSDTAMDTSITSVLDKISFGKSFLSIGRSVSLSNQPFSPDKNIIDDFVMETLEKSKKEHSSTIQSLNSKISQEQFESSWQNSDSIPFLNETSTDDKIARVNMKMETSDVSQDKKLNKNHCNTKSTNISEKGTVKSSSFLEDAIDVLVQQEPIVGLEYMVEFKNLVSANGSLSFFCKLCNSSIARMSAVDHVIGSKHRLKYLKIKDEDVYKLLCNQKLLNSEKDKKIASAASVLEKRYGRGRVNVEIKDVKKIPEMPYEETSNSQEMDTFSTANFPEDLPKIETILEDSFSENTSSSLTSQQTSSLYEREEKPRKIGSSISFNEGFEIGDNTNSPIKRSGSFNEKSLKFLKTDYDVKLENDISMIKRETLGDNSSDSLLNKSVKAFDAEESSTSTTKNFKSTDSSNSSTMKWDSSRNSEESSEKTQFLSLLDLLSQNRISSEEEAELFTQAIGVLLKSLLCYKLKGVKSFDMEQLMASLSNGSPEALEKLLVMIRSLQENTTTTKENSINIIEKEISAGDLTIKIPSEDLKEEKSEDLEDSSIEDKQENQGNNNSLCNTSTDAVQTSESFALPNPNTTTDTTVSSNVVETKNTVANVSAVISTPQVTTGSLLPPPFFNWTNRNAVATSNIQVTPTTSPSTVQSNFTWTPQYHMMTMPGMAFYPQSTPGVSMPMYPNAMSFPQYGIPTSQCNANFALPLSAISQPPPPPPPIPNEPSLPPLPPPSQYSSVTTSNSTSSVLPPPLPPLVQPPPLPLVQPPPPPLP